MVWVVSLSSMELIPHRLTMAILHRHSEFEKLADLSALTSLSVALPPVQ